MRLDQALLARGLAPSRSRARDLIRSGHVLIGGRPATKPGQPVGPDTEVSIDPAAHDYVSRAALKLVHGLDTFGVAVEGRIAADIGSSTGGFTEVLLERGAARVYSIDVGTDQLHERLRAHPAVVSLEGTNARDIRPGMLSDPVSLVVCDVSFISITKALPAVLDLAEAGADLVTLVKPQFELGRDAIGKNGRVLTPLPEQRAFVETVIVPFLENLGWVSSSVTTSPVRGGEGTTEYLLHAQKAATRTTPDNDQP